MKRALKIDERNRKGEKIDTDITVRKSETRTSNIQDDLKPDRRESGRLCTERESQIPAIKRVGERKKKTIKQMVLMVRKTRKKKKKKRKRTWHMRRSRPETGGSANKGVQWRQKRPVDSPSTDTSEKTTIPLGIPSLVRSPLS